MASDKYTEETTIWLLERPKQFWGANDRRKNVKEYMHYHDPESQTSMFIHSFEESPVNAMQFGLPERAQRYAEDHKIEGAKPVEVEVTMTFRFNR